MRRRLLTPPLLALVAVVGVLALTGCSEEEPILDDGTQVLPLAGLADELEEADVDVVSADVPSAMTAVELADALAETADGAEAVRVPDVADGFVAFDPAASAGLLGLVGDDAGATVALVFDDPSSAAVFAAGDPDVFTDDTLDGARSSLLAGNVVAYVAAPDDAALDDGVRGVLEGLGDLAP